ncbi:hypothetical protein HRI_003675400 [Hibiscus trionum]|nr:hypothetical protein HRI_003675400 [Hibiscus trionum]
METLIDGVMHYERNEDDQSEPEPGSVEHVLESLEYLSIYYMKNIQSICRGSNRFGCMSKLKFLELHACPQLSKIFSHALLENFVNLEEIILEDCPQVTSLVSQSSVEPAMSDKTFLPSLKRLLLLYLPELISISNGLLIAPMLESIGCYNCPKLTSMSKMELSSKTLKIIKGECQWWEDMNWNEAEWGNRPDYLMRIFSPIDNEKDVMTQLVEHKDLLGATIQNEGQQQGDKKLLEDSTHDHNGQFSGNHGAIMLDYTEGRIMGTDGTESPSACILPSNPLWRTSRAPEQAGSFTSERNKCLEDDYCDLASKNSEIDVNEDEPKAKRWNYTENENKGVIGSASKTTRVHNGEANRTGSKVFDDGYRWRKHGQKMFMDIPFPRPYYECLSTDCSVQKHVEQDSQDTSFPITTYQGIHDHDWGNVRRLHNLHSQAFSDHRANSVEDSAETAKTMSPTKGYGDVCEGSLQDKEAHPGPEEDLEVVMRKRRRMVLNREYARRSRMRKQKHLDDIMARVIQLRKDNDQILTSIDVTSQHYLRVKAENSVLRTQANLLSHRLQSLNQIISFLNGRSNGAAMVGGATMVHAATVGALKRDKY